MVSRCSRLHGTFEICAIPVAGSGAKLEQAGHSYNTCQVIPVIFGFYYLLGPPCLDFFLALAVESTITNPPVPVIVVVIGDCRGIASKGLLHNGRSDMGRQVIQFRSGT